MNNYRVKIKMIIDGKQKQFTRYVKAESEQAAAIKAEEYYEEQGHAAFCKADGHIDNRLPFDIK